MVALFIIFFELLNNLVDLFVMHKVARKLKSHKSWFIVLNQRNLRIFFEYLSRVDSLDQFVMIEAVRQLRTSHF